MGSRPTGAGDDADVEGVGCHLDKSVGVAPLKGARVAGACGFGEREDSGLEDGRGDGVEEAAHGQEVALAIDELAAITFGAVHVFAEDCGRVVGMASLGAIHAEAAD